MAKADEKMGSNEFLDDPWDDTLLIKAYDDSIKLAREELARRIALSTSKATVCLQKEDNSKSSSEVIENILQMEYKIGNYVRATYEDGIDYEAKIMSIDENTGTCILKYIGYENEQEVPISDLIASWGKKSRRLQFAKAKSGSDKDNVMNVGTSNSKTSKKNKSAFNVSKIPPPPPMPPMLTTTQNAEDSEHLSAMLMSWYMSGYYTGVYQGMQLAKSASKEKKQ